MAASKWQAVFQLYLVLSAVGPGCDARRLAKRDVIEGKIEGEKQNWSEIRCPAGLEANQKSGVCSYDLFEEGTASNMWATTGSKAKLIFEPHGGVFMLESQFMTEMAEAFTDKSMKLMVASALALEKMKVDASFKNAYEETHHHFNHSTLHHEEHSALHRSEESLEPGFFLLEHSVEHLALEGLLEGFHVVAHHAAHQSIIGAASMAGAAVGAEALEFVVHFVIPVMLPIQTAFMIWSVHSHLKENKERAEEFTSRMVLKSNCMVNRLRDFKGKEGILRRDIGDICTMDVAHALEEQLDRTAQTQIELFEEIAALGGCLWPDGRRSWSKTNCVQATYYKLLQYKGKSGILYEALAFVAYYGSRVDELLVKPHYSHMHKEAFGIEMNTQSTSLLPQLHKLDRKPLEERLPACMQMLATHRAFERTFARIKGALRVWAQAFSRDFMSTSIRSTWWPCQKVFYKIEDFDKGMCKHHSWPEEELGPESEVCERAAEYKGSWWPETEEHMEGGMEVGHEEGHGEHPGTDHGEHHGDHHGSDHGEHHGEHPDAEEDNHQPEAGEKEEDEEERDEANPEVEEDPQQEEQPVEAPSMIEATQEISEDHKRAAMNRRR